MMPLGLGDVLAIAGTALGCTALVTALAFLALRLNRRGPLGSQIAIVAVAAILSVAVSTVAIAAEMYLSDHDLTVLVWVAAAATILSLGGTWFLASVARRSIARLGDTARRIGAGEIVEAPGGGWREFQELAAELSRSSERLAAARAEVERLDASRRQLVAWVSHDLRTPLAGIRAMAEALEEGVAADPVGYVRRIREQVDFVNRMVDGLFELSRIQSGTLRLSREPVVLRDLVSDAVADMRPIAAERDIRISEAGMSDLMLVADPHELTRVVVNLLANSIRHAPAASEIIISAHREDGDRVVLSVLDQGPGVATEDLGRMFEVGWRGAEARTHDDDAAAGAGLGLAIVRGIVEAHGGLVQAERVADGFRLDVVLPAAAAR